MDSRYPTASSVLPHPAQFARLIRAVAIKLYRAEHSGPEGGDAFICEQTLTETLSMPGSKENNWRPS
jgi:hypothetical protein